MFITILLLTRSDNFYLVIINTFYANAFFIFKNNLI